MAKLEDFVRRGQAAQLAVDRAIEEAAITFPPWKRCAAVIASQPSETPGQAQIPAALCQRWTRGAFCPRHQADRFENETAGGAGGRPAAETHPRGTSGLGASPARGDVTGTSATTTPDARRASNTPTRKARKRNA